MGTGQPRRYISHCPRHLSNKTRDSKRCYRSRELSQDCDQETRADCHRQDSTCLEGLKRYSKNVVKDSTRPFTSQESKTPVQLPPHKAKHFSSPPAQQKSVGGKKKKVKLPSFCFPVSTVSAANVQFLSVGHRRVDAPGNARLRACEILEM